MLVLTPKFLLLLLPPVLFRQQLVVSYFQRASGLFFWWECYIQAWNCTSVHFPRDIVRQFCEFPENDLSSVNSPLLLIFPNQTQSEFRSISAFSGNNICFAVYHKMKRGYLKVWFCHSVWKCMLEMMEIALHCVIPKSVIAYCFANHISHCLILITVNGFRCFVTQRKYQRRDKKTK